MNQWYQAVVPIDFPIERFFQVKGFLGSMEKENFLVLYFEKNEENRKLLKELNLTVISEGDWVEKWREYFVPVTIGRITVVPPWRHKEGNVVINPSKGFGTGHHETTKISISLIEEVLEKNSDVTTMIDVGTGSGILAVSALRLNPEIKVTAIDNDPEALENTFENAFLNDTVNSIDISNKPLFEFKESFDFVVANIISSVLYFLSDDLKRLSSKWLLLSGILDHESEVFVEKMSLENFELIKKKQDGEWVGFIFKRK
ncbi:MAG: 50S ribosomal protein L11 methyltransferase [bacterium]